MSFRVLAALLAGKATKLRAGEWNDETKEP